MRNPEGFLRLATLRHGMTIHRGQESVGCAGRVEQDGWCRPAKGRAFHDPDQKPQNRKQRIRVEPEDGNQHRKRNRHRDRPGQSRRCADKRAKRETREHHNDRDRDRHAEDLNRGGTKEKELDAPQDMVPDTHYRSPLGGRSRSSKGRS